MNIDMRDVLIGLNIIAMLGGAGIILGSLRTELRHLAESIRELREWLKLTSERLRAVETDVAIIKNQVESQ